MKACGAGGESSFQTPEIYTLSKTLKACRISTSSARRSFLQIIARFRRFFINFLNSSNSIVLFPVQEAKIEEENESHLDVVETTPALYERRSHTDKSTEYTRRQLTRKVTCRYFLQLLTST